LSKASAAVIAKASSHRQQDDAPQRSCRDRSDAEPAHQRPAQQRHGKRARRMGRQRPMRMAVVMPIAVVVVVSMMGVIVARMAMRFCGVHARNVTLLHFALSIEKTTEFRLKAAR
jgi:hypothetical protein